MTENLKSVIRMYSLTRNESSTSKLTDRVTPHMAAKSLIQIDYFEDKTMQSFSQEAVSIQSANTQTHSLKW